MLAQEHVSRGRYFVVKALRTDRRIARLGIIAARKAIRRAVDRNACKRIVREAFREHSTDLAGLDVVVVCRMAVLGSARKLARRELDTLLPRLATGETRRVGRGTGTSQAQD